MALLRSNSDPSVHSLLSPAQRDLLMAALHSQTSATSTSGYPASHRALTHPNHRPLTPSTSAMDPNALLTSPPTAEMDGYGADLTPDFDYLDGDGLDFENTDLGGDMIGALPGSTFPADGKDNIDSHEKRKSPDENGDSEEGDAKRQETQDGERQGKKVGRKPLTSEPTTKRKAQNRAAQRAFRERKEKHLKDLETKVSQLTKASEADKHENGLLKAQVERLQVELRDYRKRLSLNGSSTSRSPTLGGTSHQQRSNSNHSYGSNFQFDFPKFGALPGSQIFGDNGVRNSGVLKRESTAPQHSIAGEVDISGGFVQGVQLSSRANSTGRSLSPGSNGDALANTNSPLVDQNAPFAAYSTTDNMHGFASTLPQMSNTASSDPFGDLFSPSILKSASPSSNYFDTSQNNVNNAGLQGMNADGGNDSTSGLNRVFHFNGGSNASDSTSPSASSTSQWNANGTGNSSCGTSPEPLQDSPGHKFMDRTFYQKAPPASRLASDVNNVQSGLDAPLAFGNGDFGVPSLETFDPVLFGDYRDSNAALANNTGGLSGGFFDDALDQPFDMSSPSNLFGILQSPQQTQATLTAPKATTDATTPSKSLMAEIDRAREGTEDGYGLSNAQASKTNNNGKMISCNNIWMQLQSNSDFQDGKFDLDGLCSELRAKARCSESGVMVEQDHVDQALRKLGKKDADGKTQAVPPLMFEQESWDNVMRKLQSGGKQ